MPTVGCHTVLQLPEMLSDRGEMFMVTVAENDPEGGHVMLSLVGNHGNSMYGVVGRFGT